MEEQEVVVLKKPKKGIWKIFLAVVLTAVISVSASFYCFQEFFKVEPTTYTKLTEIQNIVDNYYYGEADPEQIEKGILQGYVYGLGDKYAAYLDISDSDKRSEDLKGNATGIGIIVVQHPDTGNIYVKNVYDNAPAKKSGIKPGDQITAIDSVLVTDSGYAKAVSSIQREIGETVEITVLRDGKTLNLKITYSEFVAQTVFHKLLDNGYGYVEITSFNSETVAQFKNAVNDLVEKKASALIFDVRGNGGGTVDSVTEMVDFLCPEGDIMKAKYGDGSIETIATSDADEIKLPMVVLTDEDSASASELFTASLIEFGKGVSVGSTTFGKGVMQATYGLADGSSLIITIAEFFVHNDVSFDGEGIEPEVPVELTKEEIVYRHISPLEEDPVIIAAIDYLDKNNEK